MVVGRRGGLAEVDLAKLLLARYPAEGKVLVLNRQEISRRLRWKISSLAVEDWGLRSSASVAEAAACIFPVVLHLTERASP